MKEIGVDTVIGARPCTYVSCINGGLSQDSPGKT